MKKALSILASFSLTTSGVLSVVSCQQQTSNDEQTSYLRNDLNNLVGAISSEAKAIILDNEFGISQQASLKILNKLNAKDMIKDFNPDDYGMNEWKTVGDVVKQYLEVEPNQYRNLQTPNISLGHKKGELSGIDDALANLGLPDNIASVIKTVKDALGIDLVKKLIQSNLTGPKLIDFFNQAYSDDFKGIFSTLIGLLKGLNIKKSVDDLKPLAPIISKFFNHLFDGKRNDIFKQLRDLSDALMDDGSDNYLVKILYDTSTDSSIPLIKDIPIERSFAEIMNSVRRILKLIYLIPDETNDQLKSIEPNSDQETSLVLASFLSNLISGQTWEQQDLTTNLVPIIQEIFRIITITNAYFSFFDDIKTYSVKDSQHLFSDDLDNYQYLNQKAGGQTLGNSKYVEEQAINLNYFIANMDYYFGSLSQENETSAYRLQQGLFLIVNDPVKDYQSSSTNDYENKTSFLTNQLLEIFLILGIKNTTGLGQSYLTNIFNSKQKKNWILDNVLKPIIVGLSNGDDIKNWFQALTGVIEIVQNQIPELGFFKDYVDDIKQLVLTIGSTYSTNTIHHLLVDDLRGLFKNLKVINNELLNRWFGFDQKVNLQSLFAQPLSKILQVFNVNGLSNNLAPLGENYLNSSIPELVNFINLYVNKMQPTGFDVQLAKYNDGNSVETSLKTLNLNLPTLRKLLYKTIGSAKGEGNVLSSIVDGLMSDGDNSSVKDLGLNFQQVAKNLGLVDQNTFEKDSFLGLLIQTLLPLQQVGDSNIVVNQDSFKVDLITLWLQNAFNIFLNLDQVGNYDKFVDQIVHLDNTFNIKIKADELTYFLHEPKQIQKIALEVEFISPFNLAMNHYLFRIERKQTGDQFKFVQITSDKSKGGN